MILRNKKSILFVRPDYHCSFFYQNELRNLGWKADIFVPWNYPTELLYSDKQILRAPRLKNSQSTIIIYVNHLILAIWWLSIFWRYEYHLYYGRPPVVSMFENRLRMTKLFGEEFLLELWLSKFLGIKLIFLPTSCREEATKAEFAKLDNGNVCENCGAWNRCCDKQNNLSFKQIRRFFDMQIGVGANDSLQFAMTHIKYKAIDLELWNPAMQLPKQHVLTKTNNIKILHSSYLEKSKRTWQGRNIKGSPFILKAIEKLKMEGYAVEYVHVMDKPSNEMRFYQAQADIVVDQLIYGWWGSTFVETAALGKPVVCFLRPAWKTFFLKKFPEYSELPIIEANTRTIYQVLKRLVEDDQYRRRAGDASRKFAEMHFNPVINTQDLIRKLEILEFEDDKVIQAL